MKYLNKEEKAFRREILSDIKSRCSIADIAANMAGLTLVRNGRSGRFLKSREFDSLVIDLKNNRFVYNRDHLMGDIFDFVKWYYNTSFDQAVEMIYNYYQEFDETEKVIFRYDPEKDAAYSTQGFVIPNQCLDEKGEPDNSAAIDYLLYERGISESVVNLLLKKNMLFQDEKENCVFIGYDEEMQPKFGCVRGTKGKFRGDCSGSSKFVGYNIEIDPQMSKYVLCESVIDGLSYLSLDPSKWDANIISASGCAAAFGTLKYALENRPNVKKNCTHIVLALDNDDAGNKCTKDIYLWLKKNYPDIKVDLFYYKNELKHQLVNQLGYDENTFNASLLDEVKDMNDLLHVIHRYEDIMKTQQAEETLQEDLEYIQEENAE